MFAQDRRVLAVCQRSRGSVRRPRAQTPQRPRGDRLRTGTTVYRRVPACTGIARFPTRTWPMSMWT